MTRLWGNYFRIIIVVTSFLCLVSICSNHSIINLTFICMKEDFSLTTATENGTLKSAYDFNQNQKTYINWAVGFGTILGTFPMNYLFVRIGARIPFFSAGILSAIATGLTPFVAGQSMWIFVTLRFLQLCASSTFGWKWSFYLHAVSGSILFVTWFLLYKDDPTLHKSVSSKELLKIQKNKSEAHIKDNKIVPYLKIFTSPVILTVWFCAFTELSTFILISQYAPAYFREVLGFDIVTIGLLNGIMTAIHIPFRFVCAFLSDKISFISEITKIHIFNTLAVGCVGISFIVFGFIPAKHNITAVVCLAILECFMSFNSGGFYKCGTLHARQFSSTVISAIQFSKCVALITGPALVNLFVSDESNQSQWSHVFMTLAATTFVANILSFVYFMDQPAEWTKEENCSKKEQDVNC
ncbi:hypothetical protein B9Z55_013323 [Caenorhabditis nigoni]|uniref:Major facilitator superfamily (MFS) profile domain-containing protein n=1 Tax=Caenorhabditis nigoni TaxID=1611254 RepID=A0A2G5U173_9PELO|nr:hypothetical protein B9Z55_013323 [Caenorhabditis nigoni]